MSPTTPPAAPTAPFPCSTRVRQLFEALHALAEARAELSRALGETEWAHRDYPLLNLIEGEKEARDAVDAAYRRAIAADPGDETVKAMTVEAKVVAYVDSAALARMARGYAELATAAVALEELGAVVGGAS